MAPQAMIQTYPSTDALSASFLAYLQETQSAALQRHDKFKVAVSGGSLPALLAKSLLSPSALGTIQFSKWQIFFADERAVPLDHEDSNYGLLKKELLDKIPESEGQPEVITIDTEYLEDLQELADQYEQSLIKSFAAKDAVMHPIFDLLLLGAGPDGHTCSLFPGHALLRETDAWVAPIADSPKPPSERITLTLPVISHALKAAYVVTGDSKKDIIKTIFEKPEEGLPCSLVNQALGDKVTWFVEEVAVVGLNYPKKANL